MIKKAAVAVMAVLVFAAGALADEFFFPTKAGTVLINANMNKKGKKVKNYTRVTIKDVEGEGDNLTVTSVLETLDKKRKLKDDMPIRYKVRIVDGAVVADMNSYLDIPAAEGAMMTMTGDTLRLPPTMTAGQRFDDAKFTITVDLGLTGAVKSNTNVEITDFKCLAVENIRLPSGTFEAYKVTQKMTVSSTLLFNIKITSVIETWHVRGIGPVKTVTYNNKGKVMSWQELHDIKR